MKLLEAGAVGGGSGWGRWVCVAVVDGGRGQGWGRGVAGAGRGRKVCVYVGGSFHAWLVSQLLAVAVRGGDGARVGGSTPTRQLVEGREADAARGLWGIPIRQVRRCGRQWAGVQAQGGCLAKQLLETRTGYAAMECGVVE